MKCMVLLSKLVKSPGASSANVHETSPATRTRVRMLQGDMVRCTDVVGNGVSYDIIIS